MYTVTPHDLTKWCKGLLRYSYENETDAEKFILEIVYYEAISIFGDKLTSDVEKHKSNGIVSNYLQKAWGYSGSLNNAFYVPFSKFGNSKKSYMLSKVAENEWTNSVTKGIHIYGNTAFNNCCIYYCVLLLCLRARRTNFKCSNHNRTFEFDRQVS